MSAPKKKAAAKKAAPAKKAPAKKAVTAKKAAAPKKKVVKSDNATVSVPKAEVTFATLPAPEVTVTVSSLPRPEEIAQAVVNAVVPQKKKSLLRRFFGGL